MKKLLLTLLTLFVFTVAFSQVQRPLLGGGSTTVVGGGGGIDSADVVGYVGLYLDADGDTIHGLPGVDMLLEGGVSIGASGDAATQFKDNSITWRSGGTTYSPSFQYFTISPLITALGHNTQTYQFRMRHGNSNYGLGSSSGMQYFLELNPHVYQSGVAGYRGIWLDVEENTLGSGAKELIHLRSSSTTRFKVDNLGNGMVSGNWEADTGRFNVLMFDKGGTGDADFNLSGTFYSDTISMDTTVYDGSTTDLVDVKIDTTDGQLYAVIDAGGGGGGEWDATANGQTTPTTATSVRMDTLFLYDGTFVTRVGGGVLEYHSVNRHRLRVGGSYYNFNTSSIQLGVGSTVVDYWFNGDGFSVLTAAAPRSALDIGGGQHWNTTTVNTSTYDVLITDHVLLVTYTTTGAVTSLTLPTAQTLDGRVLVIKDAGGNANTNNITIDTEGSQTIDGSATFTLDGDDEYLKLCSDGSNWFIIGFYDIGSP